MKEKRMLKAAMPQVDALIQTLADQDAGKKAHAGLHYRKKVTGMNGHSQSVRVVIDALEPGLYQAAFETPQGTSRLKYAYRPAGDGQVELLYEESFESDKKISSWNQKIASVLFGLSAKKQIRQRLDLFEQQLEATEWQD